MRPVLAETARHNAGVFSRRQALASGYSPEEIRILLREGLWLRLRRGVYVDHVVLDLATPQERAVLDIAAARLSVPGFSIGSHTSAARAYDLPLLAPTRGVDLTAGLPWQRGSVTAPITVYADEVPAGECWSLLGVPVTSPARTIVDLAEVGTLTQGVTMADAALRRGLVSIEELRALAAAAGRSRSARVLAAADGRSESVLESVSRVSLALLGVPAPELQVEIYDSNGRFVGRVDFLWRAFRVIGEADGMVKYDSDPTALRREKLRQEALEQAGYRLVRWTWDDVWPEATSVARRLFRAFAAAA